MQRNAQKWAHSQNLLRDKSAWQAVKVRGHTEYSSALLLLALVLAGEPSGSLEAQKTRNDRLSALSLPRECGTCSTQSDRADCQCCEERDVLQHRHLVLSLLLKTTAWLGTSSLLARRTCTKTCLRLWEPFCQVHCWQEERVPKHAYAYGNRFAKFTAGKKNMYYKTCLNMYYKTCLRLGEPFCQIHCWQEEHVLKHAYAYGNRFAKFTAGKKNRC